MNPAHELAAFAAGLSFEGIPAPVLARFGGGASADETRAAVQRLWQVAQWPRVGALLA